MKLFRISKIICNSYFTKKTIDKEYGVDSVVIYPPIDTNTIKPKRKENIIFSVGRFSKLLQSKRQDVLVEIFKSIYDSGFKNWKLVLAGGIEIGNNSITEELEDLAVGYPVSIVKSPSFKYIKDMYGKCKIYWSASGFQVDDKLTPQKVEHFGMAVVESMSAGAVPVIYNSGGHKEIIENGTNGYLWNTTQELKEFTENLLNDKLKLHAISSKSKESSRKYGLDNFVLEVGKLF